MTTETSSTFTRELKNLGHGVLEVVAIDGAAILLGGGTLTLALLIATPSATGVGLPIVASLSALSGAALTVGLNRRAMGAVAGQTWSLLKKLAALLVLFLGASVAIARGLSSIWSTIPFAVQAIGMVGCGAAIFLVFRMVFGRRSV